MADDPAPCPSTLIEESDRRFRVQGRVYVDPGIFAREMERIFHRGWVYVGHESQVPEAGDYLTTTIGLQPVILSRSDDGGLHLLFNRCSHRGSVLCREERGHANYFRCPYHAWVFANDGSLVSIAQRTGYPEDFDRSGLDLCRAPAVGSYRGLVFASLDADVPSLGDRLAHVRRYVDLWLDHSPVGGLRVTGAAHRYEYPGNWKLQLENGIDGYHGNYVHESFAKLLERSGEVARGQVVRARNRTDTRNFARGLPFGDALLERDGGMLGTFDFARYPGYREELDRHHGRARADDILLQRNLLLFPNLYLFESHIRVIRPLAVDRTIVEKHPTLLEGVPDELNLGRLREHERFFGPASFGATDDVEVFVCNQTGITGAGDSWVELSRGLHRERVEGVERIGHSTDETTQRSIWRAWREAMAGARAEVSPSESSPATGVGVAG